MIDPWKILLLFDLNLSERPIVDVGEWIVMLTFADPKGTP